MSIRVTTDGAVTTVVLERPKVRNAVDAAHAAELTAVFEDFDADPGQSVAVLTGAGGTFCSGADLKAVAEGAPLPPAPGDGPAGMGPTRLTLSKPVIA
ncbi:MAG: enoyl-CoA hydratase-related protein, partial [Oryzihumus sp.]